MEATLIYPELNKISGNLLKLLNGTETKEEFLALLNEKQFESMRDVLGYCFYKVNEIALNYCESVKRGEKPQTDERDLLFAFPIAAIAGRIGVWDGGSENNTFYHYGQFARGRFSERCSREILKNQKAIEDFSNTLYHSWCEVHQRGVFLKLAV